MSLILHYPLNGDTLDYSGGNVSPIITAAPVFDNLGKIGRCMTTGGIAVPAGLLNAKLQSLCFWYYNTEAIPSTTGSHQFSGGAIRRYGLFAYPNNDDLHYSFYDQLTGTNTVSGVITDVLPCQKWTHICLINDNLSFKIYINGTLSRSFSEASWINDFTSSAYDLVHSSAYHKLNDLRVYDHALSPSEVKEIFKTKILHYTFDEKIQLLPNEFTLPTFETAVAEGGWSHWGRVGSIGTWGQNTDRKYIYGNQTYSHWVANGGVGGAGEFLLYQAPEYPGGYRSLQAIIKVDDSILLSYPNEKICFPSWNGINGGAPLDKWTSIEYLGDGFFLCKCEGISQDGTNDLVGIFVKPGYKIYVSKVRLEQSRFCSNIFDETHNLVADSSGFNNHSFPAANHLPEWTDNSKMGSGAFKFNPTKSNYLVVPNSQCKVIDTITVSAWAYRDNWQDITGERIISCTESGGWQLGFNDTVGYVGIPCYIAGVGYKTAKFALIGITPGWHHLVGTFDGVNVKFFFDGELKDTIAAGGTSIGYNATNGIFVGAEPTTSNTVPSSAYWNGLIDDVRIYATALSADDIKELYDTRLIIDIDKNNVFTNEVIENQNLFDLDYIYEYGKRLNLDPSNCIKTTIFGVPCVGIGAAVFYKGDVDAGNLLPHQINIVNGFKPNTQYVFDIILYNTCYNAGSPVPGGMRLIYSDGTEEFYTTATYLRWTRVRGISQKGKTIAKIGTYYYTGSPVYYSYSSKIVEYKEPDINIKSQLSCSEFIEVKPFKPTLVDYSIWNQLGKGSLGSWGMNGTADENERMIAGNPYGEPDYVWVTPGNDAESEADGGFNHVYVPIDKTKKYRVSIWMRKENAAAGVLFLGTGNGAISALNSTVAVSNPYFHNTGGTGNEWFLWVAYIHPYDFTGTVSDVKSGLYDITGTKRFGIGNDFKWLSTAVTNNIRAYLYYSTTVNEMAYFYRPRFEICNGLEPSIEELIAGVEHSNMLLSDINDLTMDQYGRIFNSQIIEN